MSSNRKKAESMASKTMMRLDFESAILGEALFVPLVPDAQHSSREVSDLGAGCVDEQMLLRGRRYTLSGCRMGPKALSGAGAGAQL